MKPIIGLIPLIDEEKESFWMLPGYMQGVEEAGGLAVMLPLLEDKTDIIRLFEMLNGIILTGGHDVCPSLYGFQPSPACGAVSPQRDHMESILLRLALKHDRPILGICRGIQLINVLLGGTLWQDLPTEHPSEIIHHQNPPYDRAVHTVHVLKGTPLAHIAGTGELPVNSYHHQAIRNLAPGLFPMAFSKDGLVEALWLPENRFVWGVQWHPEFSFKRDSVSRAIFRAFVKACEAE